MTERGLHRLIGAGVYLGLAATVALLLSTDCRRALRPGIVVQVELGASGPLRAGAPVRVAGVVIGRVEGLALSPGGAGGARVVLTLHLDRRHAPLVRENSHFFVTRRAMLAEAYVEVALPPGEAPGPRVRSGAWLPGQDPVDVDQLLQKSHDTLAAMTDLLRDLPEADELAAAAAVLEATLARIDAASGGASPAAAGRRLVAELEALVADAGVSPARVIAAADQARGLVARADAAAIALGPAARELRARADALGGALAGAELAGVGAAIGRAGAIAARIERLGGEVGAALVLVERGHGTIGALLSDDELGDEVQQLARELKRQPWRLIGGRLGADASE